MVMMMMVIPIMWEDGWEVFGRVGGIQCTVFLSLRYRLFYMSYTVHRSLAIFAIFVAFVQCLELWW